MVSATREAPSGVLSGARTSFPNDYGNSVLVACWGESVIERHTLQPDSLSASASSSALVSGDRSFRPVAMANDSKDIVYITDWASNRYDNHTGGRLWRLKPKQKNEGDLDPSQRLPRPTTDAEKVVREIRSKHEASDAPTLLNLLTYNDAFMTHAAVESLAHPVFWESLLKASKDTTPSIRLGALLALRKAYHPDTLNLVRHFLSDSDQVIRITALLWATEVRDARLRPALDESILDPKVSLGLLETYLAAKSALSSQFLEALETKQTPSAFDLPSPRPSDTLTKIITSKETNDHLRSLALMQISDSNNKATIDLLARWARKMSPFLQLAAIQGLSEIKDDQYQITPILRSVAENRSYDPQVRAEAIAVWAKQIPVEAEWAWPLLDDHRAAVRLEAARALRLTGQVEPTLSKLKEHYLKVQDDPNETPVAEQLEYILYGPHADDKQFASKRPSTLTEWQTRLQTGGNVNAGRRLFNAAGLLCSQCHTPGAFRNSLGPNLENLGQSVHRNHIIQSLIEPTTDASPTYQAWRIVTKSGVTEQGVQLEWLVDGSLKYISYEGSEVIIAADNLKSYQPVRESIMPHGLQELMTIREMRELVSYLESIGNNFD
jgi:putative heme-binding domain-containing protein